MMIVLCFFHNTIQNQEICTTREKNLFLKKKNVFSYVRLVLFKYQFVLKSIKKIIVHINEPNNIGRAIQPVKAGMTVRKDVKYQVPRSTLYDFTNNYAIVQRLRKVIIVNASMDFSCYFLTKINQEN